MASEHIVIGVGGEQQSTPHFTAAVGGQWSLAPLERPVRIVSWNVAAWATTVAKIREAYGNTSKSPNTTHDALSTFLAQTNATILCLQETKVAHRRVLADPFVCGASEHSKAGAGAPHIAGWETFWATNKVSPGFNGVATYVKEGMTLFADPRPLRDASLDDEGRCILTIHKTFAVFNIYAPYSRDAERHAFKYCFYAALLRAMARVRNEYAVDGSPQPVCKGAISIPAEEWDEEGNANTISAADVLLPSAPSDGTGNDGIAYDRFPLPPAPSSLPLVLVGDFNLVRAHRDMHWTKWSLPLDYWIMVLAGVREGRSKWWEGPASASAEVNAGAATADHSPPPIATQADVAALVSSRRCYSFENNEDPIGRHKSLLLLAPFLERLLEAGLVALGVHIYNRYVDNSGPLYAADPARHARLFCREKPSTLEHALGLFEYHLEFNRECFYDVSVLIASSHMFTPSEQEVMHTAHTAVACAEVALAAGWTAASSTPVSQTEIDVLLSASGIHPSAFTALLSNIPTSGSTTAAAPAAAADQHQSISAVASVLHSRQASVGVCLLALLSGVSAADPHMRRLVFGNLLGDEFPYVGDWRVGNFKHVSSGGNDAAAAARAAAAAANNEEKANAASNKASHFDPFADYVHGSPIGGAAGGPPTPVATDNANSDAAINSLIAGAKSLAASRCLPRRMIDAQLEAYPNATRAHTCWDQSRNGRTQNFGSRIDYIFLDEALRAGDGVFRYDSAALARAAYGVLDPFSSGGPRNRFCAENAEVVGSSHIRRIDATTAARIRANGSLPIARPFLLRWIEDSSNIYGGGLSPHDDSATAAALLQNRSMALVGLEYGRAFDYDAAAAGASPTAAFPLTRPVAILSHKVLMRSAAAAGGLFPSAPPTGEGMPAPTFQAREAVFVPQHMYEDYIDFLNAHARGGGSEEGRLTQAHLRDEVRQRFARPLLTGFFGTASQYSDHAGVVAVLGGIDESDLYMPETSPEEEGAEARYLYYRAAMLEALRSASSPDARKAAAASFVAQWAALTAKAAKAAGRPLSSFAMPPSGFEEYAASATAATIGSGRPFVPFPINVSRIITREARDMAFPERSAATKDCSYRQTQRTILSMFGKMNATAAATTTAQPSSFSSQSVVSKTAPAVSSSPRASFVSGAKSSTLAAPPRLTTSASAAPAKASPKASAAPSSASGAPASKKPRVEVEIIDLDDD